MALVTGSGRGLGFAIAQSLARQGAAVALHDVREDAPAEFGEFPSLSASADAIRTFGTPVTYVVGDVADEGTVARITAAVASELGPISILVNCAGGDIALRGGKPKPNNALGVPLEDVQAILNRNLLSVMLVSRAVCPGMIERKTGSVVNIASTAAHLGVADGVAYAVAKAGVVEFTRCLAVELRPHGVRVNAVSPGPTRTARFLNTRPIQSAQMSEGPTLERYGIPSEIGDVVAFLAGDGARFVSGQVLRVDGGGGTFPA
ncbi:MAG: SDR family oxidoreductase [Capsulimonadales bacterium]|nr:SDR family oxidoreductase [Capsulimonadales bacterium]